MEIKNFTEPAVREEVVRTRREERGPVGTCWCPLCESDMISLAMTSLPPCYGRGRSEGVMKSRVAPTSVREAVRRAVDRVSRHPKHPRSLSNLLYYQVRIVNFAFEAGVTQVDGALSAVAARCHCRSCQADTLALALNRFPPLYGVDFHGRINLPLERKHMYEQEMGHTLASAARVVASNPHHRPS